MKTPKLLFFLLSISLMTISFTSCTSDSDSSSSSTHTLQQKWKFGYEQTGYFYLTFKDNGTFVFENKMNRDSDTHIGKYSESNNVISITDDKDCGNVVGKYPYKISDGELSFNDIKDECAGRRMILNHVWKKAD